MYQRFASAAAVAVETSLEPVRIAPVAVSPVKRLMDIAFAGSGFLVLAPLFLMIALLIRLDSRGPVVFRQKRSGLGGAPFTILKFRTMRCEGDVREIRQATRDDPRITRVGAFLRRSSLDELPQLLNVIAGDMSLVGPRPHALAHDQFYGAVISTYGQRFSAKPGITGLAQVKGLRGETAEINKMAQRVNADVEYIERWTPLLDVEILVRTVFASPFCETAY